jgi:hypothetical protein
MQRKRLSMQGRLLPLLPLLFGSASGFLPQAARAGHQQARVRHSRYYKLGAGSQPEVFDNLPAKHSLEKYKEVIRKTCYKIQFLHIEVHCAHSKHTCTRSACFLIICS